MIFAVGWAPKESTAMVWNFFSRCGGHQWMGTVLRLGEFVLMGILENMKGNMMSNCWRIPEKAAELMVRMAFLLLAGLFVLLGLSFLPVIGVVLAFPLLCLANCIRFEAPVVTVHQRSRRLFRAGDWFKQDRPVMGRLG
jgi:hypothetical protein